jgi:hypothetical protein
MTFAQRINKGAVTVDIGQRRTHALTGERPSAPRPDLRRNSRRCS